MPGEVEVVDGELRFTVVEREHGRKERLAVQRLGDERALGQMLGPEPLVLRFALGDVTLAFPKVPGGRSLIRIRAEGRPKVFVTFLDLGVIMRTSPYRLLWHALSRGPAARRERDALRAEIERAQG